MPWHDIGIQTKGDSVIDMVRHFVQYWYFVDEERIKDPYAHFRDIQRRYDRAVSYNYPDWETREYENQNKSENNITTIERSFMEKCSLCGVRTKLFLTGT